jgi:hypothetical protein
VRLIWTVFLVASVLASAPKAPRRNVPAGWPWDTIPQIADGGNWKTTIILVNLNPGAESRYKILFHGDDGSDKPFPLVGLGSRSTVSGVIQPRGSVTFETTAVSATLNQGWAELDLLGTDEVGIMAVFGTQGIPGRPDYEATVIGETGIQYDGIIAFDNSGGFVTSMAVLNPNAFATSTVPVRIYDQVGTLLREETMSLQAGRKVAFATTDRWPETRGKRGTIHFDGSLTSWAVLGLRFHPGGAFTTVAFMDR